MPHRLAHRTIGRSRSLLRAGGASAFGEVDYTAIHVSSDRGRTWKVEDTTLADIIGGTGVATTCWFEDTLWAANETGIARRIDGRWKAVSIPANQLPEVVKAFYSHKFVFDRYNYHAGRFAVVDDQLYFLGNGIARWNGSRSLPSSSRRRVGSTLACSRSWQRSMGR